MFSYVCSIETLYLGLFLSMSQSYKVGSLTSLTMVDNGIGYMV